jgi:hypothetical protein
MQIELTTEDNNQALQDTSIITNNAEAEDIELKIEKEDIINKDMFFGHSPQIKNPRRLGNTFAFFYNKNGEPRIVIGPHCKIYQS